MQTAPPNKMALGARHKELWPRAQAAFAAYECACEWANEAERRHGCQSNEWHTAMEAVAAADKDYKEAVRADEQDHRRQEKAAAGPGQPRIKCACGSWLDPEVDGPRCPDCDRKIPAVVRRQSVSS